jgi:two-component system phosphate regulon sensor histidine kinase PhoR
MSSIIAFAFVVTLFVTLSSGAPIYILLVSLFFYYLIYYLTSKKVEENKKLVIKSNNSKQKDDIFFSEKNNSIFSQNKFPMLIVNKSFTIESSNMAFNSFIGKDAKGMNLSLCLRSNELNDALSNTFVNQRIGDINFIIYDQVHKYIQSQVFPIKIKNETHALIILIDETSEKVSQKVKSDFVSNVSHELKTPLTAIIGFIETINGPAKDDSIKKEKFLKIIQSEAERMQRLVNDTLSLTRVEESQYQTPNEKVDLWLCASSAIDSVRSLADKKRIKISFNEEYKAGVLYVRGNQDQITEIFENLLDNAITYSSEDTRIKIMFFNKEKTIKFKVLDQGCGIQKDDIVRVSERFFRSKTANKYKKNSSGLGLSIVKHIVKRHAGNLYIDSEEGVGSTFSIDLPKFGINS